MIDHLLGRPSSSWRRTQVFLVIFFWVWRLYKGDGKRGIGSGRRAIGGRSAVQRNRLIRFWQMLLKVVGVDAGRGNGWFGIVGFVNRKLHRFSPYQLLVGTLTLLYAARHMDDILGLSPPEPLARMYSRSYYRATYITTAFDAGFATAMTIRPQWLKDLCSMVFTGYYLIWAKEADETLRKFRALCTVEMLRVTWEKTNNPYVRLLTHFDRPRLPLVRRVLIPRPSISSRAHLPPVPALLFFPRPEAELADATELVLDFPGGGFIAMGPECHEERLRRWAKRLNRPVLSVEYGKAPEYPYPYAIEQGFDAYRTLMESKGKVIGIESDQLDIVLTGDSAGGNIVATIMLKILEHGSPIPRPTSMILAYPALDFNFTSWMTPSNLRTLRSEQSESNIPGIAQGKDHMRHKSPLSVVDDIDVKMKRPRSAQRKSSWAGTLNKVPFAITPSVPNGTRSAGQSPVTEKASILSSPSKWTKTLPRSMSSKLPLWMGGTDGESAGEEIISEPSDSGTEDEDDAAPAKTVMPDNRREQDKSLSERVKTPVEEVTLEDERMKGLAGQTVDEPVKKRRKAPIGTRLTMTSRTGYFQDRIISPSMMRAMAILYIGPKRAPDFQTDYYISPILSPPHLLAHFPPVYLICGEKDPFVDDTVIFAGKLREAKRALRAEAMRKSSIKPARFGEGLRMSSSSKPAEATADERILRESDEDWVVQMRIIEGWGHGFMQMVALMREIDGVLSEMADWIDDSFEKATYRRHEDAVRAQAGAQAQASFSPGRSVHQVPHILVPPTTVSPARAYKPTPLNKIVGGADLGTPVPSPGLTNDGDDILTFTPKKRRSPPSSTASAASASFSSASVDIKPARPGVVRRAEPLSRNSSAPRFDDLHDFGGTNGFSGPVEDPKGKSGRSFGLFGSGRSGGPSLAKSPPPSSAAARRISGGSATSAVPDRLGLVAAAAAGARAVSPALAHFAGETANHVTQVELMRRRRAEAVLGMGETDSAMGSDTDD